MHAVKVGLAGIEAKTTGILGLTKDAKQKDQIQKLVDVVKDVRSLTDVPEKPAAGDAKPEPKIDPKNPKTELDLLREELAKRVKSLEAATKGLAVAANPAAGAPAKDGPADGPADDGPGGAPKAKPAAKPAAPAAAAAKPGDAPAGAAGN